MVGPGPRIPRAGEAPEPDKLDPDRAPDLVGEVLGWRQWQVSPQGDLLSANGHCAWRPGENRAVCGGIGGEFDHPAPQENCQCGWYALHTDPGAIRGIVRGWGKLVVHPDGFRSEWSEIVCLVADTPDRRLKRAAGYYDVPIFRDPKEALAYARKGGHDVVPEGLRPEKPEPSEDPYIGYTKPLQSMRLSAAGPGPASMPTPPEPKPRRKIVPFRVPVVLYLAGLVAGFVALVTGIHPLVWFAEIPLIALGFLSYGIYEVALRLRCLFGEVCKWGSGWHDTFWHETKHRRSDRGIAKGDHCPDCGWRLRK